MEQSFFCDDTSVWIELALHLHMPEEILLFPFFYWIAILQWHVLIKISSTMASNNRAELQQRLSVPTGYSKADRGDGIEFLLVQLVKDISIIRKASN